MIKYTRNYYRYALANDYHPHRVEIWFTFDFKIYLLILKTVLFEKYFLTFIDI